MLDGLEKEEVLFIYPSMMLGGSTTSLLSILNSIDYKKYEVDILFYNEKGVLYDTLPKEINVLSFACKYSDMRILRLRKLCSLKSCVSALKGRILAGYRKNHWIIDQFGSKDNVRFCRVLSKTYDIAVSFLEFWPMYYLAEKVSAKRKIAWIHTDCVQLNLEKKYENRIFRELEKIVLISEECRNAFIKCFPEWKEKTVVVENFISKKLIMERAKEQINFEVDSQCLNFVTTCRIDFGSKGLDRAVRIVKRLNREGYTKYFRWYIIGTGSDEKKLEELIKESGLSEYVTLLGQQFNPFPYEIKCDVFFLPSRYEGKPLSVVEAQALGLVPVITDYSSAREQVCHMQDGIILENEEEAIFCGLKEILCKPEIISKLAEGVQRKCMESEGKKQWENLLHGY